MTDESLFRLLRSPTTGNVPATDADREGELAVNLADHKIFLRDASGVPQLIAAKLAAYSASLKYAVGDVVIQGGAIYQCTTAVTTPEAFDSAKWTALGASFGLTNALIKAPDSSTRNQVQPTGNYPGLKVLPNAGQIVDLVDINGSKHDARGIPVGRYGGAVFLVSQTGHGFTAVGQAAAFESPNWVLAQAGTSKIIRAVVHEILDANNVLLQSSGIVRSLASGGVVGGSWTAGTIYYLSTTAGKLTSTPPASGAQAAVITLSTTVGALMLAGAAGAPISTSGPGGGTQTLINGLQIVNPDADHGFNIDPATQEIASIAGTPGVLQFQESGTIKVLGGFRVGGNATFEGLAFNIAAISPTISLFEIDQTAPGGRYRLALRSGGFFLQRATSGDFTAVEDLMAIAVSGDISFTKPVTFGQGLVNPVLKPAQDLDNSTVATLALAVPWVIAQAAAGTAADMELRPSTDTGNPQFKMMNASRSNGIIFTPSLRLIDTVSSALNLASSVTLNSDQGTATAILYLRSQTGAGTASLTLGPDLSRSSQWDLRYMGVTAGNGLTLHWANTPLLQLTTAGILTLSNIARVTGSLQVWGAGNRTLYMMDENGAEVGLLYSDGTTNDIRLRLRLAGTTAAQLRFTPAGEWFQDVGGWGNGINFLSDTVADPLDLTRHIRLFGTTYGWSITSGHLNHVANGIHAFYQGGDLVATLDANDTGTVDDTTVMTRVKGDTRYRNATNLNAGTVSVDRLPTSSTERDRILALLATTPLGAVGDRGVLRRSATNTAITKGGNVAGSSLRWAGISTTADGWTADVEDADNTAPSGTWQSRSSIAARSGTYCIGEFIRIA